MRAFYPIERGNPCAHEVATRTIKNQFKTKMCMKLLLKNAYVVASRIIKNQ